MTAHPASETWLLLEDYEKSVNLGVFHSEHDIAQKIRFDIALKVHNQIPKTDQDIDQILSYDMIIEAIETTLAARRYALLERMADDIADALFHYPNAQSVKISIRKLERLETGKLGITLKRDRDNTETQHHLQKPKIARLILLNSRKTNPELQRGDVVMLLPQAHAQKLHEKKQEFYRLCQESWAAGERLALPVIETMTEAEALIASNESFVICPFSQAQQYILRNEIFDEKSLKDWAFSLFDIQNLIEV